MRSPRRRRKVFPYYKIQVFDEISQAWKDERKVSDTIEEAQDYIERKIRPRTARVMVVYRDTRHVLGEASLILEDHAE
jgi:hypothetical protein